MVDNTASAKSLLVTTDANTVQFEEVGGTANDNFVLDLANNRVGIGSTSPGVKLDIVGAAKISTTINGVDTNSGSTVHATYAP